MSHNSQLVSIIVPVYNVDKYIKKCLDSIILQTHQNMEIILIDDGSFDHSADICDEYSRKDARIIVVHKKNGGVSSARNIGLAAATGEYLMWVDSDDWCEPDSIEFLFSMMKDEISVVIADYVKDDGIMPDGAFSLKLLRARSAFRSFLRQRIEPSVLSKLYRRELFDNTHFAGKIAEDEAANFDIFRNNEKDVALIKNKGIYHYCTREDSITHDDFRIWRQALGAAERLREIVISSDKKLERDVNFKVLYVALLLYGSNDPDNKVIAKRAIKSVLLKQHYLFSTLKEKKIIASGWLAIIKK